MKNTLAVIAAFIGGSIVNSLLVSLNGIVIPFPEGVDVTSMSALAASMHLFEPIHFLFPWLGHALGTFVGAFIAAKLVETHKMRFALGIGVFFLLGGLYMNFVVLSAPAWFAVVDLVGAYLPMAWLGGRMGRK